MTLNYRKSTFYDGNDSLSQEVDEIAYASSVLDLEYETLRKALMKLGKESGFSWKKELVNAAASTFRVFVEQENFKFNTQSFVS